MDSVEAYLEFICCGFGSELLEGKATFASLTVRLGKGAGAEGGGEWGVLMFCVP